MALQQILALNERGVRLFSKGKFLGYEDVITLASEQIAEEREQKAERQALQELIEERKQAILARG